MKFIPALFFILQIFINYFSGVKPTNDFCYLAKDNPNYGFQLENLDEPKCSLLDGNIPYFTEKKWKQTMAKTLTAAEAVRTLTKNLLVEVQLESALRESLLVVQRQKKELLNRKIKAAAAKEQVFRCREQVRALTEAVKNAEEDLSTRALVLSETQRKVHNSRQLVDAKKKHIEELTRRIEIARADYENTKMAVEEAARQKQAEMEAKLQKLTEMKAKTGHEMTKDAVHIPKLPLISI